MNHVSEDSLIRAGCVDVSTLSPNHPVSISLSGVIKGMADQLAVDLENDFLKHFKEQAE